MITAKQEQDISDFCEMMLEDIQGMSLKEIKGYLKSEIR